MPEGEWTARPVSSWGEGRVSAGTHGASPFFQNVGAGCELREMTVKGFQYGWHTRSAPYFLVCRQLWQRGRVQYLAQEGVAVSGVEALLAGMWFVAH